MDTKYIHICPVKKNNINGIERTRRHNHIEREGDITTLSFLLCTAMASAASEVAATHAHARVHGQLRSVTQRSATQRTQHRFDRNQSTISQSRRGATRSARAPTGTYTHPRVHARKVRGEARTVDGCFDVAAALLSFRHPNTFIYVSRAPLFLFSLFLSSLR